MKYIKILLLLLISVNCYSQVPYYAGTQGKNNVYTYFSTKFHPGHNNQIVYITAQYGLNDHFDAVTELYSGTGWSDQGFGFRFNGFKSKYLSLGGQLMADFNVNDNYKYDWTCGSLYLNGNIYKGLHWVSNTWYTINKGSTKNQVDQWTYLGYTIGKFTPMIGCITNCTDNFKSDLAVGCYANLYKNGYVYLWGSGLTNNVYNPRIVIGFDYKY